MKRLILVASLGLATCLPAVAQAKQVSSRHRGVYYYLRRHMDAKFGPRAAGRNILRDGLSDGRRASDAAVVAANRVMERMLAPPRRGTPQNPVFVAGDPPVLDSLAECVEAHESGGNPQAVNGQYEGIGQWSATAWAEDGGLKYASTPLGATKAQQEAVLASEGDATLRQQQGQYDGCS